MRPVDRQRLFDEAIAEADVDEQIAPVELRRRVPVWWVFSEMWADTTHPDSLLDEFAEQLAASGFHDEELARVRTSAVPRPTWKTPLSRMRCRLNGGHGAMASKKDHGWNNAQAPRATKVVPLRWSPP